MLVRNVSPLAREIPGVGECDAGGTIEVPDELGCSLCEQPANWEAVTTPAKSAKNEEK